MHNNEALYREQLSQRMPENGPFCVPLKVWEINLVWGDGQGENDSLCPWLVAAKVVSLATDFQKEPREKAETQEASEVSEKTLNMS